MTLETVRVDVLTERAKAAGLDGSDRGAVRRLVWSSSARTPSTMP